MYLVIAIVLFAIVFACSSTQQHSKNKQYEEYKSHQRKKTSREYYYAQFYYLELIQKLIPVFEEYKKEGYALEGIYLKPTPRSDEIVKQWKAEVLTVNYQEYTLEGIAVCKAREAVIAEGYMPSDPYKTEYYPSYNPWRFPERHQYRLQPGWPKPASMIVSTYIVKGDGYQEQVRNLNEVAEKFGYHDFCDTILHLHFNEKTGLLYSEPAAEPCFCDNLNEQLLAGVPKTYMDYFNLLPSMLFGLRGDKY